MSECLLYFVLGDQKEGLTIELGNWIYSRFHKLSNFGHCVCVINHYEEFPSADSAVSSYFVYILGANLVTIVVFKFPRVLMVVNSFFIDTCHNLCVF